MLSVLSRTHPSFISRATYSILQVDADTSSSDPVDTICSEVPEHLRVLFLTTVQDNHLSQSLATGLQDLFQDHADIFVKGPTDIGYCDLLQSDIDTGDTFSINQSPPLSACRCSERMTSWTKC